VIQINALPIAVVDDPGNGRTAGIAELLMRYKDAVLTPEVRAEEAAAYERVCAEFPNPRVTMDDFVRHIEHAVAVAGVDHVGIGCDFDGGGGFDGLRDVGEYPNLTAALLARGWREPDLKKLWGENTLRVIEANQKARRALKPVCQVAADLRAAVFGAASRNPQPGGRRPPTAAMEGAGSGSIHDNP